LSEQKYRLAKKFGETLRQDGEFATNFRDDPNFFRRAEFWPDLLAHGLPDE